MGEHEDGEEEDRVHVSADLNLDAEIALVKVSPGVRGYIGYRCRGRFDAISTFWSRCRQLRGHACRDRRRARRRRRPRPRPPPPHALSLVFRYGSNMSSEHLRNKKNLDPLASHRTVLRGYRLSFPEGFGIDFVEPAFATLVRDPDGEVHGVCTLFSADDAQKLDKMERVGQERGYVVAG